MRKIREIIKKISSSKYFVFVKIFFAIAILYFFFRSIDLQKVFTLFSELSVFSLFVLLFLTIIRTIIGAFRFKVLIGGAFKLPINTIIGQYFIGSFYNTFLPTSVGGDAIRMRMLTKEGLRTSESVTFVFIERLIGVYALFCISFISGLLWMRGLQLFNYIAIGFFIATLGMYLLLFTNLASKIKFLNKVSLAVDKIKDNKLRVFISFLLSIIFQFVSVYVSYYISYKVLGITNFIEFLSLVPIVWLATMIPISFGGIGVREITFTYLLAIIGIGAEESVFISIGTYITILLAGLIGMGYQVRSWVVNKK